MRDTTPAAWPPPGERIRAIGTVKRHARDSHDEAELLSMLGLDRVEAAPPKPPRPHDPLTTAEVYELLAPFAATQ